MRCHCAVPQIADDGVTCHCCGGLLVATGELPIGRAPRMTPSEARKAVEKIRKETGIAPTMLALDDFEETTPLVGRPRTDAAAMRVAEEIEKIDAKAREAIRCSVRANVDESARPRAHESMRELADALPPLLVLDIVAIMRKALARP